MTREDSDACVILKRLYDHMMRSGGRLTLEECWAEQIIRHAIRHLAYPDRDVYPKTRRGTKGVPIVRR